MSRVLACLLLLLSSTACFAEDHEFMAWVGLRSGTLAAFDHDTLTEGTVIGWRHDVALRPWLRLRLGGDRAETHASSVEPKAPGVQRRADYRLEQTAWRIGLVPRLQAGPATLMLGAEWLWMSSEEVGDSTGLYGEGRRRRDGLSLGGTSQIPLAESLELVGEASGYRVDELEGVDAGMRLIWSPQTRAWRGTRLYLEGIERRVIGPETELRERDVRLGVSRRF